MQSHLKHSRTRLMFHSSSGLSHCRFRRPAEKRKALNAYKKLPLSFIPNESQTDEACATTPKVQATFPVIWS
jgi:hypothetical protein